MLLKAVRTCGHRLITGSKGPRAVALARHRNIICRNKIGDELLDFVTAGPKLRKWYGAGDRPTDGGEEQEPEEPDTASDVVLVTEADSPIGEQLVLQLILARQQLRLSVRDVAATKTAYGPYATPIPAEALAAGGGPGPGRALRGVKCLVLLGRPPRGLLEAATAARGVRHVVLLSAAPSAASGAGGFSLGGFSLGGGGAASRELRDLADGAAEAAVKASGLPYSVVQVSGLLDQGRGGAVAVRQGQPAAVVGGNAASASAPAGGSGGGVSREALGALLSGLVDVVPERGRTLQAAGARSGDSSALSPDLPPQRQREALEAALAALRED